MKHIFFAIPIIVAVAGCAVTPEQAEARRAALLAVGSPFYVQPNYPMAQRVPTGPAYSQQIIQPRAATAYWTGKQEQVQTVTYQAGWNCEYNFAGQLFWRTFVTSCPSSVQVQ